MKSSQRFIMRIELTKPAKKQLAALSDRTAMTQIALMSRLVEWFAGQPNIIQDSLLNRSDYREDLAKLALEIIAKKEGQEQ